MLEGQGWRKLEPIAGRPSRLQREIQKTVLPNSEFLKKGPMGQAFIITNPLIPPEYFAPKGLDKLVVEMNKRRHAQLARLPAALHRQSRHVQRARDHSGSEERQSVEAGRAPKSYLESAATNAHILTEALRNVGSKPTSFMTADRVSSPWAASRR